MDISFVDDNEVPRNHAGGRPPHPVDAAIADSVRNNPGKWAIYPLKDRYPDRDPMDRAQFSRMVDLVRKRIAHRTNAFRTYKGRYETRTDRRAGALYIRYTT